jgi:primosomal protein N' (replication factor Y)
VTQVKPLRLKTQRAPKKVAVALENPVVQVCVDTGIFHLPNTYDYLVPEELSTFIQPGVFVKVPFGKAEVIGYVQSREASELDLKSLKIVSKIISRIPLLTEELIEIIDLTCERYACKPWDVIRSAIPARVAAVDSEFVGLPMPKYQDTKPKLKHLVTVTNNYEQLAVEINEILEGLEPEQQLLVIVPDERDIKQLVHSKLDTQPLILTSDLSKSDRYTNYLKSRFLKSKFICGTRSAIFTPLAPNSIILIFNDGDESMYERRFPSWNVRDIAMLRSGEFSLHFIGASPSLEVVRLAELGWIKRRKNEKNSTKIKTIVHFSDSGASDIALMKAGLKKGNVLVVMAETGYINAIACQKCRNQARCECGGKIYLPDKNAGFTCAICQKVFKEFICSWCDGKAIRSMAKGSSRIADEIAKAVPGYRVLLSKGGSRIDDISQLTENVLVIASYGCEPLGDFSTVILRSLENLSNRVDLRSLENVRRMIFENRGRLKSGDGTAMYLDLAADNLLSQGLIRNDAYASSIIEIKERENLNLPPFCRIGILQGKTSAIRELARNLEGNDLFSAVALQENLRESAGEKGEARLVLRCDIARSHEFSDFFRDLARYRGIKGLSSFQLRMDPFSI